MHGSKNADSPGHVSLAGLVIEHDGMCLETTATKIRHRRMSPSGYRAPGSGMGGTGGNLRCGTAEKANQPEKYEAERLLGTREVLRT